jgi:hypothetical protein
LFEYLSQLRSSNVPVPEKLRNCSFHREVHIQFPLARFQGEVAASEEGHDPLFVCLRLLITRLAINALAYPKHRVDAVAVAAMF